MPIPPFTFPDANIPANIRPDAQDGFLRRRFVKETHAFLSYIVEGNEEDQWPGLPADRLPFLHQAWIEVAGRFRTLEHSVTHIESRTVARHGIGGAQLRFKLGNVARSRERLNHLPEDVPMGCLPGKWRDYIDDLLESIDTILESILEALDSAVPPAR